MRSQRGMTLVELMIVVVIVAILAAIAVPSYRQYVLRANRASGKTLLLQIAQSYERCYTRLNTYAGCAAAAGLPLATPEGGTYIVSEAGVTPTTYSLQAVPQGAQAQDTSCATLLIDQLGLKTSTGTSPAAECWSR